MPALDQSVRRREGGEALIEDFHSVLNGLHNLQFACLESPLEFVAPLKFDPRTEERPERVQCHTQLAVTRNLIYQTEPGSDVGEVLGGWEEPDSVEVLWQWRHS